jgi:hypothetical protein
LPKKRAVAVDLVRTRQLAIEDAEGRLRLLLDTNPDGNPNVRLLDENGHTRLDLFLRDKGEPGVNINDRHGRGRIVLGLRRDGTWFIELLDWKGRRGVENAVPTLVGEETAARKEGSRRQRRSRPQGRQQKNTQSDAWPMPPACENDPKDCVTPEHGRETGLIMQDAGCGPPVAPRTLRPRSCSSLLAPRSSLSTRTAALRSGRAARPARPGRYRKPRHPAARPKRRRTCPIAAWPSASRSSDARRT